MQTHGASQHHALEIAPPADKVLDIIPVADALNILLDDRTFIQVGGSIVRGSADQFDPPRVRLMVRLRSDKSRQEGMMDIDNAVRITIHDLLTQYLHVSRQHNDFDAMLRQQLQFLLLLQSLGLRRNGEYRERNAVTLNRGGKLGVIADYDYHVC